MLINQTEQKLTELRLSAMAAEYIKQQGIPDMDAMDFDSRFGLLVDTEWLSREDSRIKKLTKDANLRIKDACFAGVRYTASRKLERGAIARLSNFAWVKEARNILITGCTGTGKSWLACAFGNEACRRGLRVSYHRVNRLLTELRMAMNDGSETRLLTKLSKTDILILDDWGLQRVSPVDGQALLEVLEDRYDISSTIVTAQAPVSQWHAMFDDSTVADAVLDRLINNAYRFELQGPSLRRREAVYKQETGYEGEPTAPDTQASAERQGA